MGRYDRGQPHFQKWNPDEYRRVFWLWVAAVPLAVLLTSRFGDAAGASLGGEIFGLVLVSFVWFPVLKAIRVLHGRSDRPSILIRKDGSRRGWVLTVLLLAGGLAGAMAASWLGNVAD